MAAQTAPATMTYSPGLEGVIAGETAISTVAEGLSYRGYKVTELCGVVTFDEVAYLLLHGDLPTAKQLAAFTARVAAPHVRSAASRGDRRTGKRVAALRGRGVDRRRGRASCRRRPCRSPSCTRRARRSYASPSRNAVIVTT